MRKVLRRPDFRLLFAGVVATMVGESALFLVLAIWVKDLTGSNSLAGITLFALAAPALAAPLLGWVVDRFRRKPFIVAATVATALAQTPLLFVRDSGDIWLIYGVAVLYGVSLIVVSAALNALIKELLPEELLAEANGALQTVRQGLRLVGPLGGAALFTMIGGYAVVTFTISCLLVGAATIGALKVREERPAVPELHWLGEVAAGVKQLFGQPALRRSTIGLALAVTVVGFIETLIFAYVDLGLHRGPAFVSVIVCVQGIGGLTGGLLAATRSWPCRWRSARRTCGRVGNYRRPDRLRRRSRPNDQRASRCLTSRTVGLVSAVPSENRTVGTVWLPPLTFMTNSVAAASCSMSTT